MSSTAFQYENVYPREIEIDCAKARLLQWMGIF